ncbi:hypothetical protein HPB48_008873 [Haemaphysalis longicornis]|uniref:RRM domain-containing protein n=1 Tax=Haemaphysalis longicornis TaxID=44386 RepID=A0A9J6H132_HAELO|nr:hypothetical protein HPB48_008873 [Haemaphysalis longicornis]
MRLTRAERQRLFVTSAGPLEDVTVFNANDTTRKFAFVTFKHQVSVGYALALMEGVTLYGREIKLQRRRGAVVDDTYPELMRRHYARVASLKRAASLPCCLNEAVPYGHAAPSYGHPLEFYYGYEQVTNSVDSYGHHSRRRTASSCDWRDVRERHQRRDMEERPASHSRQRNETDERASRRGHKKHHHRSRQQKRHH